MMTIPSIDLMDSAPALPIGELATRALDAGAEFASAVSTFQQAMASTPVFAKSEAPGAPASEPKPLTLPEVISRNAAVAATLPEPKPLTLPEVISRNTAVAATLPEPKSLTLPEVILRNATVAATLPEPKPLAPSSVDMSVIAKPEPATSATLKAVVEETIALMPKPEAATPAALKAVVEAPEAAVVGTEKPGRKAVMPGRTESAEEPVLQAAPAAVPTPVVVGAEPVEAEPAVAAVEATRVAAVSAPGGSEVLLAAANAVAETMMVSPGLMRGEGEIRVMLKPDVLEGTELSIRVAGGVMSVEFLPSVERVTQLLVASQAQLVQHLSERIHSFQITVNVAPRRESGGKVRV